MKSFLEIVPLNKYLLFLLVISVNFLACSKEKPMATFEDLHYSIPTHSGIPLIFPDSLKGRYTVFGFFYTHCPDICPLMVANMKRVDQALGDRREEFDFIFMSFDPKRDSVEVLSSYFNAFRLDEERWTFLAGSQQQVDQLTQRMGVKVLFQPQKLDEDGNPYYLIDHTDKVSILNDRAELVAHFNASRINPDVLARELLKLKDN